MAEIKTLAGNMTFTECPRWHEGRWWFSDFYTHAIYSMKSDGSDLKKEVDVPAQPSGLGWLPDGRLIFVSMKDRKVMAREADGSLSVHADVSSYVTGHPNDMVVGPDGVAYLGNFGFDLMGGAPPATANLLRIAPDGSVKIAAEGLHFPNGSVITPDGRMLIVDESFGNRTSAFDITSDGLGPRRDWAVFGPIPKQAQDRNYVPDGCGLDAEGALWIADAGGGRVCRVREGGEILETIEPGTGVFACMLGGEDGRDLIMCCAPDFYEHKRSASKEAELRVVRVKVPRAGWP
ncbi:gluconolactonase [Cutaneotrichosporon oleaginosum]|uniref:Gluconolactonase n=1 Tax=Cutaneotrichosporon oleaginosum TaxID=879819 RepID=A0A0J0XT39_9TREE|nr:gluconolactonase [Cutaneotrichosporon oleaginosum]KLT44242.1 gluconolactonase [Cutaneotrichosporon oleaginosum]TXT11590.1 hypothetical protein COLE_02000 [Cutaneotrichosporon oleaginosum]